MQLGLLVLCSCAPAVLSSCLLGRSTCRDEGVAVTRVVEYLCFKSALVAMLVMRAAAQEMPEVTLMQWLPWVAMIGQLKGIVSLTKGRLSALSVAPASGISQPARMLLLQLLILAACGSGIWLLIQQLWGLSQAVVVLLGVDMVKAAIGAARAACSCLALLLDDASATHSTADIKLPDTVLTTATVWWSRWYSTKHDTLFHRCDLLGDISQQLITLIQHISIWFLHGFGCNVLDALLMLNIRAALLSIVKRLRSHRSDQAVLMKLNNSLPDAEVCCCGEAGESECVICRDKMTTAKKLPCGHVFHLQCLRAWIQQQSSSGFCSCPICRRPLSLLQYGSSSSSSSSIASGSSGASSSNTVSTESRGALAMYHAQHQWQQQQRQQQQQQDTDSSSYSSSLLNTVVSCVANVAAHYVSHRDHSNYDGHQWQQQQQQQRRESGSGAGRPLSEASSDTSDESYDALMQQALLASLQTSASHAGATTGSSSSSSGDCSSSCNDGIHGGVLQHLPRYQQHDYGGEVSLSNSSSNSSSSNRSNSSQGYPAEASNSSSSIAEPSTPAVSAELLERLNSDRFQWSDPLTDTDAAPLSRQPALAAASRRVSQTCSCVLSALLSGAHSPRVLLSTAASAPTAATAAVACVVSSSNRPGDWNVAAATAVAGEPANNSSRSNGRYRKQQFSVMQDGTRPYRSRTCCRTSKCDNSSPDVQQSADQLRLPAAAAAALSKHATVGRQGTVTDIKHVHKFKKHSDGLVHNYAAAGAAAAPAGAAAAPGGAAAVLLLRLQSPRAKGRRRDAGKWGRRHWTQQQQQQQQEEQC